MSLNLKYPYQENIAQRLSKFQHGWEPYNTKGGHADGPFIQPGSSAAYPMYNATTLNKINKGELSQTQAMRGNGIKKNMKNKYKYFEKELIDNLDKVLSPKEKQGGKISLAKIKKAAMPVLKQVGKSIKDKSLDIAKDIGKDGLSSALDYVIPAIGAAVTTAFSMNPAIGAAAGALARKVLQEKTGLGVSVKGVGVYEGGNYKKKAVTKVAYRKEEKKPRKANQRCLIVKKVMKEHPGMKLCEASKYVKEHNLY
jgi:hypothetical protein